MNSKLCFMMECGLVFQPIAEKLVLSASHLLLSLLTTVRCSHFSSLQMLSAFYGHVSENLITSHSIEVCTTSIFVIVTSLVHVLVLTSQCCGCCCRCSFWSCALCRCICCCLGVERRTTRNNSGNVDPNNIKLSSPPPPTNSSNSKNNKTSTPTKLSNLKVLARLQLLLSVKHGVYPLMLLC